MRNLFLSSLMLVSACSVQNDPELVGRISVDKALQDVADGSIHMSETLASNNVWLGVKTCSIKINLALSANMTKDGKVGITVTAQIPSGPTVGASGNLSANAADMRSNTVAIEYRNVDTTTCPPEQATKAATTTDDSSTDASKKKQPGNQPAKPPTQVNKPPAPPASGACNPSNPDWVKAHPKNPGENDAQWLQRVCHASFTIE